MSKSETPAAPIPPAMTDEEAFRQAITTHTDMPADQVDELVAVRRDGPSYHAWKAGKTAIDTAA